MLFMPKDRAVLRRSFGRGLRGSAPPSRTHSAALSTLMDTATYDRMNKAFFEKLNEVRTAFGLDSSATAEEVVRHGQTQLTRGGPSAYQPVFTRAGWEPANQPAWVVDQLDIMYKALHGHDHVPSWARPSEVVHDVICDHCKAVPIIGMRYRCAMCANYDLCETCMKSKSWATHDPSHLFLAMSRPVDAGPSTPIDFTSFAIVANRDGAKHAVQCAACGTKRLVGYRFACVVCMIDLCEACEAKGVHDPTHTRLKMAQPTSKPVPQEISDVVAQAQGTLAAAQAAPVHLQ